MHDATTESASPTTPGNKVHVTQGVATSYSGKRPVAHKPAISSTMSKFDPGELNATCPRLGSGAGKISVRGEDKE